MQVLQRADDVRKVLNLLQLLNDGIEVQNMMEGYFDFKQFQVPHLNINSQDIYFLIWCQLKTQFENELHLIYMLF